ncbi:hypothetical protein [Roseisolibacter sp. H3M3-2]|uniref:hypothetical protein n=1 Tax=Roseisolibacter sp. H3M3-2 TaxID=3031323 RepID=UPI0023DA8C4F|nr:hypothetical protein [Roseisolibacter sp. H3M3-2]MDF1506201.1 hypothetical protein [Roseisolibacter sp. H3M3-2]
MTRASAIAAGLAPLALAACGGDAVRVRLHARTPAELEVRRVEVQAQVAGPVDGLRYRWYSVAGETEPQESDRPETLFTFAEGSTRDRVTVEVWRARRRVARHELDVRMDEARMREAAAAAPQVDVVITRVPPFEPGGPETRADVAGRVVGRVRPGDRVVVFARAGEVWYIQPLPDTRLAIGPDGRWSSWTHTGTSYAALVIRPGFEPLTRYDVLPAVGPQVVARTIVNGGPP